MNEQLLGDRYKIINVLGAGGMGQTYVAEDTQLPGSPKCVVKQLKPASNDPNFLATARRLFTGEAEILQKLGKHNQIPQLLAYFERDEEFYLVQEFIDGQPLSAEMPLGQRWQEPQVVSFLKDLLGILEFIHGQGVIHRDIKPDNIMRRREDGKLVLIDFGAVKQVRMQQATAVGQVSVTVGIGTPGYMPTEQSSGKPRPSSDIYAVGMVAIQALTGLLPSQLREDEDGETIWRDQAEISDGLALILTTMTRHYFKHRYQSALEVLQALQDLELPSRNGGYTPTQVADSRGYTPTEVTPSAHNPQPIVPTGNLPKTATSMPGASEVVEQHRQPAQAQPQSVNSSSGQFPRWLIGILGSVSAVVISAVVVPAIRQQVLVPFAQKPSPTGSTTGSMTSCIVISQQHTIKDDGAQEIGIVQVGTQVTPTGQADPDGWMQISAPVNGWIYKPNTTTDCSTAINPTPNILPVAVVTPPEPAISPTAPTGNLVYCREIWNDAVCKSADDRYDPNTAPKIVTKSPWETDATCDCVAQDNQEVIMTKNGRMSHDGTPCDSYFNGIFRKALHICRPIN